MKTQQFLTQPRVSKLAAILAGALFLTTSAMGDIQGQPKPKPKPPEPNVLERIGNAIFRLTERIERSDVPDEADTYSERRMKSPRNGKRSYDDELEYRDTHKAPRYGSKAPSVQPPATFTIPEYRRAEPPDTGWGQPNRSGLAPVKKPEPTAIQEFDLKSRKKAEAPLADLPDDASVTSQPLAKEEVKRPLIPPPSYIDPKANEPSQPAPKKEVKVFPVATRASVLGRVKSPYPPYRELDITGLASGSLVKDPTTGQMFRLP